MWFEFDNIRAALYPNTMTQIVPHQENVTKIHLSNWTYNKEKVVLAKIKANYYLLCHVANLGFIFKNVREHRYGANGYRGEAKDLVDNALNYFGGVVWEFDSISEAMKFVDSEGSKV